MSVSVSEQARKVIAPNPEEILELLWARVKERGELPGFSKVVSAILAAMRGDGDRDFNMIRTVLSDPALTQKVLRLANSPMYAVFGQEINTVTGAVAVLGTEAMGHLAFGLKLIDGLSVASPDSRLARGEMEKALLAGHIGRQVASLGNTRDAEEARVSAMLHPLANMMVAFYLPEHWQQIQQQTFEGAISESVASIQVLGASLDEIARRIASRWGLPSSLVDTLIDRHAAVLTEPLDHAGWLAAVATMSCRCADAIFAQDPEHIESIALPSVVSRVAHDYADMLGFDAHELIGAIEQAQRLAKDDGTLPLPESVSATQSARQGESRYGKPLNASALLAAGTAQFHQAEKNASTVQLLSIARETVFQSFGFSRAILFQRVQKDARYIARMALGSVTPDMTELLAFDDACQPDVFHAALANDKMVFVENARDSAFSNKLPRWWKDALPSSRSFLVMPLTVSRVPVGFLYGDWDTALPPSRIGPEEVICINELRASVIRVLTQQQAQRTWDRTQR